MAPSAATSGAPSGDSGGRRGADNELKHLIDALMRLIERFANWDEAADELVEIRARLDRYGAEMRGKVRRGDVVGCLVAVWSCPGGFSCPTLIGYVMPMSLRYQIEPESISP